MTIWWVNTGERFYAQKEARALWCPNLTINDKQSSGPPQWHWAIIQEVKVGEFILIARNGFIEGVAIAKQVAIANKPKPATFPPDDNWHSEGWLLPVELVFLRQRVSRDTLTAGLFNYFAERSPFRLNKHGKIKGNQVYFARIPGADAPELFERFRIELELQCPGELDRAFSSVDNSDETTSKSVKATTRDAIIKARVGQGQFRQSLLEIWEGKCCATGLEQKQLLRASHIVAWSASDDDERLSPFNGLLLSAAYDAAFDAHLITLTPEGDWENIAGLTPAQLRQAGLGNLEDHKVFGLKEGHRQYLIRHNKNAQEKWKANAINNPKIS